MKQESFLVDGYKEPTKSNYMKFLPGSNRFRILGTAKVGWEYWTKGTDKDISVRVTKEESIPMAEVMTDKYGNLAVKYFWAFVVYNYDAERIQILQVTQKSVREGMQNFLDKAIWGKVVPGEYVFDVNQGKKADGKPEYSVIAEPKTEVEKEVLTKLERTLIDMDAWMAGKDPFAVTSTSEETEMPSF